MNPRGVPKNILFGKDRFQHVSSHAKQHDAKKRSNNVRKKGFRIRIVHRKNRYHIYRGQKKRGYRRHRKRGRR